MIARDDSIDSLVDAVIDGRCDEDDLKRLEALMRDPRVRSAYLGQMRVHALLQWRHGQVGSRLGSEDALAPRRRRGRGLLFLAATLLVGLGTIAFLPRGVHRGELAAPVASLVEARGVAWGDGQAPISARARIGPGEIRMASGTLTLVFDSGAVVTLEGPAEFRVLSGMRMLVSKGRVIARAEGPAKGFAIETPNTLVVDQGTEFGVEIDDTGRTGVVVFEGLVDVSSRRGPDDGSTTIRQLSQGEGLCINSEGALCRIVAVERRPGEGVWSTGASSDRDAVIRSVRDNIRELESSKYYRIVRRGFVEDAPAYVDRNHQWNGLDPAGIPEFLLGADYIMPFNEDKWMKDLEVTVEMARAATLYVIFDDREVTPPWLSGRFTDTGRDVGLDEVSKPGGPYLLGRGPGSSIDTTFSVWRREVERGETIVLGALRKEDEAKAMYGIAAQPR